MAGFTTSTSHISNLMLQGGVRLVDISNPTQQGGGGCGIDFSGGGGPLGGC